MQNTHKVKEKIKQLKERAENVTFADGGNLNSIEAVELVKEVLLLLDGLDSRLAYQETKVRDITRNFDGE
jgi:hypothetical protein